MVAMTKHPLGARKKKKVLRAWLKKTNELMAKMRKSVSGHTGRAKLIKKAGLKHTAVEEKGFATKAKQVSKKITAIRKKVVSGKIPLKSVKKVMAMLKKVASSATLKPR